LVLLVSSACAAGAVLLALPTQVAAPLAWRLPLLLAALALGGRLRVDGPLAGQVSALGSGGLLGPPQATDSLTRTLSISAMPLGLTVLVAVAIGLTVRRAQPRDVPRVAASLAGGFAVAGLLLAVAGRTVLPTGTVQAGLVATPVGGALVAGIAALAGHPRLAPVTRIAWNCARGLLAVGLPVLLLAVVLSDLGVVAAVLLGGPLPAGLALVLAALFAPALIWDAAALGLGVPIQLSGALGGFTLHRSSTLLDAAHSLPLAAFLPVLSAATLLTAAVLTYRRHPGNGSLRRHAGALGCLGLLMYASARFGLHPQPAGGDRASVAPSWLAAVLPFGWGALLGVLVPRISALFGDREPVPVPTRAGS
jgi:hypothetical protein